MNIIIIGAGPCGLGAAWRLNELGHKNWSVYEQNNYYGGLSASFKDSEEFWWDIGGHVLFSHYPYFDRVMDTVMDKDKEWLFHDRSAWVWMNNRFIPYPIQNNIHRLPKEIFSECLHGLIDIQTAPFSTQNNQPSSTSASQSKLTGNLPLQHFGDWIDASFGSGLAKYFLRPYNYKVWAYPVEELSHNWVGERVAKVDIKRIIDNHIFDKDDIGWGPNSRFRFPKFGGTGAIWEKVAQHLPTDKIHLNAGLKTVNVDEKTVEFNDGSIEHYDILISTIPLTSLISNFISTSDSAGKFEIISTTNALEENIKDKNKQVAEVSPALKHSSTHVVGLGLKGNPPDHLKDKCWIYFPENDNPFYRVTVFSNYSPNNVPDIKTSWSLMFEVSESPMKPVNQETVIQDVIQGAVNTRLIKDKSQINHTWHKRVEKGYPTPSSDRNRVLFPMLAKLEEKGILSRGRFGAWRYEVGNMDHSFMQGVEAAGKAVYQGEELTIWYPDIVNSPHPSKIKF
ncbi:MAG: FAD-dependent oxidoreductase [Desulfamplus sp.]|nr:FAD-dependent oxidoreductase [Desulfamplus sp.]